MSATASEDRDREGDSVSAAGAVEERCPICLDDFLDKAFITTCFHAYCFSCVVRAAQVSGNRCPMCKTVFTKVIHNVRANDDYELYKIPPPEPSSVVNRRQALSDLDEAIRNFRGYRTTMFPGRREGSGSGRRAVTPHSRRAVAPHSGSVLEEEGSDAAPTSRSSRWETAAQEHVLVHISLPSTSAGSTFVSTSGSRQGSPRRRHRREPELGRNVRRCAPVSMRRAVYGAKVRALPLNQNNNSSSGSGGGGGHRQHKTRDISAAFFQRNPARVHRLGPWLSREFEALLGEEHVEFMMQLVLSLIDKVDLEGDSFVTHLEPFLGNRAAHFVHELTSFAKAPFDIIAYDGKVRYNWPANYPVPAGPVTTTTEVTEGSSGQVVVQVEGSSGQAGVLMEGSSGQAGVQMEGSSGQAGVPTEGNSGQAVVRMEGSSGQAGVPMEGNSGQAVVRMEESSGQAVRTEGSLRQVDAMAERRDGSSGVRTGGISEQAEVSNGSGSSSGAQSGLSEALRQGELTGPIDNSCFIVERNNSPILVLDSDPDPEARVTDSQRVVEEEVNNSPVLSREGSSPPSIGSGYVSIRGQGLARRVADGVGSGSEWDRSSPELNGSDPEWNASRGNGPERGRHGPELGRGLESDAVTEIAERDSHPEVRAELGGCGLKVSAVGGLELGTARRQLELDAVGGVTALESDAKQTSHAPELDDVGGSLDTSRRSEPLPSDADTAGPANSDEISLFVNGDDEADFNISHNMMSNSKTSTSSKGKGKVDSSKSKRKSRPRSPHRSKHKKKHHARRSRRRSSSERHDSEQDDSRKTSRRSRLERHKKSRHRRGGSTEKGSEECRKRHHRRRPPSISPTGSINSSITSPPGGPSPTKGEKESEECRKRHHRRKHRLPSISPTGSVNSSIASSPGRPSLTKGEKESEECRKRHHKRKRRLPSISPTGSVNSSIASPPGRPSPTKGSEECRKRRHKRKRRLPSISPTGSVNNSTASVSTPGSQISLLASPHSADGEVLVSPPDGGGSSLLSPPKSSQVSPRRGNIDSVILISPPGSTNGGSSPVSTSSGKAESLQMGFAISPPRRDVRRSSISPPRSKARGISTSVSPPRKDGSVALLPSSSRERGRNMAVAMSGGFTSTSSSESPPHVLTPRARGVARSTCSARQEGKLESERSDISRNDTCHTTDRSRGSKRRGDPLTCGLATHATVRRDKPLGPWVGRRDPLTHSVGADQGEDLLVQEAKAIEEEIQSSKRELLKSVLKKERIELLHRNLHGKPISGGRRVSRQGGVVGSSDRKLQDELMQLNEDIVSEKRRLLKVVKRMEEEQADTDSMSSD